MVHFNMADPDEPKISLNTGKAALSGSGDEMSPAEYLHDVKALLAKNRKKDAYELLQPAVVLYAEDPFLISYFGPKNALNLQN